MQYFDFRLQLFPATAQIVAREINWKKFDEKVADLVHYSSLLIVYQVAHYILLVQSKYIIWIYRYSYCKLIFIQGN